MVGKIHSLWSAIASCRLQSIFKQCKFPSLCVKQNRMFTPLLLLLLFVAPLAIAQSFTEDFESGIPSDWGLFAEGAGTINWAATIDGYESNGAALLNPLLDNIGADNQAAYYLVTPNLPLPENGQLHFKSKHDGTGDSNTVYKIMVSTAPQPDIEDFILLDSWTAAEVEDNLDYASHMVDFSLVGDGFDVYIAFVVENTQTGVDASGTSWFIDDVQLASACPTVNPDSFEVTGITTSTVNISWAHPDATYFDVQVVSSGEGMEEGNEINVNGLSYYVTDLTPETEYDVYIRTLCLGDIPSDWQLVGGFETMKFGMLCSEPIVIEGDSYFLNSNLNQYPNTDFESFPWHGNDCLESNVNENHLGGNKIYFSYTPQEDGVINVGQMTMPWTSGTECFGNEATAVFIYDGCSSVGDDCLAAVRTTETGKVEAISNFPVTAGETYLIVISTIYEGFDASVCFEFSLDFSKCPIPDEITYSELKHDSVKFTWNNPFDLASEWEYEVVPAGSNTPTTGISTSLNENVAITGLEPDTAYDFYIRSLCDGEFSEWKKSYTFRTQCEVFDLPYFTGFYGTDPENYEPCWTIIDVNNDGITWEFSEGWDVSNFVTLFTGMNQNNNHDYLVSPQLNIVDNGLPKKIRFKQQVAGWEVVSSYQLLASTTGVGVENFTEVITPEVTIDHTDGWEEVTYEIPEHITGHVNIAWVISPVGSGHTAGMLSFTDIYVFEECDTPSDLSVSDITETSATLSWTPASAEDSEWEVIIQNRGEDQPTIDHVGDIVNTPSYQATDLSNSSRLEFYVRTLCTETAKSEWVGPFEFATLCGAVNEPYFETFDTERAEVNNPDTRRYCWILLDENNDGNTWSFTDTNAVIQVTTAGNDDWLISPAIELEGDFHELSFLHRGTGDYDLEILISETDTDPASFVELASLTDINAGNSYQTALEYFDASGTVYLAIRVSPDTQVGSDMNIQIDDFSVKIAAACPNPIDIVRDAETNTFTWTPVGSESQWEVVLLTEEQVVPGNGVIVNESNYIVSDLEEGTIYKFYVRAVCDTNDLSEWTGPYRFITECNQVFTTPFIETFEANSPSVNCWQEGTWFLNNALTPYEGQYAASIYTWGGESDRWLISPAIDVEEGSMISFYYRASEYAPEYSEDIKVWLSTTGNTQEDFEVLLFEDNDFVHIEYIKESVAFPENISGQVYVAFEIPQEITNEHGFRQNVFVDNIEVKTIPDCPLPYNIEVTSIQDTQVQLSWDQLGDVDEWEVLVLPYGTENPFDVIDPDTLQALTSNPGLVTGLDPATAYDVYLRPVCSTTNVGEWSELLPVVTVCSLENQCLYTITLHSGDRETLGISGGIDLIQNGYVVQTLEFPTSDFVENVQPVDYQVYLCDGVAFSLYFDSFGTALNQYPEAYVKVKNANGEEVWTSDLGIGRPNSVIYTGLSLCSEPSCLQPTDLTISPEGELSWLAGGSETQWEVYIQPYQFGALPNEGILVNETSYIPEDTGYFNGPKGIYEFFVRAVCSDSDKSYWSGPLPFIPNDDSQNAIVAPINDSSLCSEVLENLTFMGSTASTEEISITEIVHNSGDIWVEFEATSETLSIELGSFSGSPLDDNQPALPRIVMVLYKVNDGDLEEIGWSDNNVLYTMYASELEVGETYKVRLINTNEEVPNEYLFNMCITTIDPCEVYAPNYSFEKPGLHSSHVIETMYLDNVIPGWRNNTRTMPNILNLSGTENVFFPAYHGGQLVLVPVEEGYEEPSTTTVADVRGLYQDFDSSEITQFDYSFAHRQISSFMNGTQIVQLYAGPIGGPYNLVREEASAKETWSTPYGKYDVPEGQERTRFIFRVKNNYGTIMLDAANFVPFNGVTTADHSLNCADSETVMYGEGNGQWSASEDNPAEVIMSDVESNELTVSGFTAPGEYTFYWNTRYCEDSVTITYEGIEEAPEVDSPVEYCQDTIATPLVASELAGFDLVFYTDEVGGEGVSSITPDTSEPGTTTYYAGYVDADGCEGARVPIEVIVNESFEPITVFEYDAEVYCPSSDAEVLYEEDFTYGGVFTSTPSGLALDAATGAIDSASSIPGIYEVTYTVEGDEELCQLGGTYSVTVEIIGEVAFSITTYCESGRFMLAPEFSSENMDHVSYVWRDATGNTVGTSHTLDFANAMGSQVNLPTTITLTLEVEECEFTESIDLENAMCEIPKGISPNDDGLNDTFDLSGMSVKHITIFNRYGTKVFSKANYTNEWYGQSDKGKEVPDGTYYYVIETSAGESITGWVYVNRAR